MKPTRYSTKVMKKNYPSGLNISRSMTNHDQAKLLKSGLKKVKTKDYGK